MSTILKDEKLKIDFNKTIFLNDFIDSSWVSSVNNNTIVVNGVTISFEDDFYKIDHTNKKNDYFSIIKDYPSLKEKYFREFYDIKNNDYIETDNKEKLFTHVYFDAFLYLEIIHLKIKNKKNYRIEENKLLSILKDKVGIVKNRYGEQEKSKWNRSDLLQKNANAIEWKRDKKRFIRPDINDLIESINPLLLEIPGDYDIKKLKECLMSIDNTLKEHTIKKSNFVLRFKKLGLYKKDGMFIKKANTIVVDPRATHTFKHELGHYIYENGIPFNLNSKRIYKHRFQKLSQSTTIDESYIHTIEDYKVDSEKFAHWFENI
jgi:hypothetical protein